MKSRARRAVDQFCVMSTAVDRPEVVQPPVEEEIIPSARNRRAATQRVREARDRLTSTSGTRPAFDHELLRQYAQTRLSASYVVMLLVVATGLLFGLWLGPVAAGGWTVGVLLVHAVIIRTSAAFLKEPANQAVTRRTRLQFIIYDLVYGLCWTAILVYPSGIDLLSNTFLMVLMLLVVAVSSMLSSTLPIAVGLRSTRNNRTSCVGCSCGSSPFSSARMRCTSSLRVVLPSAPSSTHLPSELRWSSAG